MGEQPRRRESTSADQTELATGVTRPSTRIGRPLSLGVLLIGILGGFVAAVLLIQRGDDISEPQSESESLPVDVVATPPPSQYGHCGSDRVYWFDSTKLRKHWLNMPGEEATAIFGRAWWDTIGHMSQSECDSWPDGRDLTTADFDR